MGQWGTEEVSRIWPHAVWIPVDVGLTEMLLLFPPHAICSLLLPGNEWDSGNQWGQTCWEMDLLLGSPRAQLQQLCLLKEA